MVEYRRDKILPEDLVQRTNLSQHNMMIDAINDIDGRQVDIEHITNINIDDIDDLKTDVVALSNEKQDKLTFDSEPVANSDNPVRSGGIYDALAGKQDTLTFDNMPTAGSDNPVKSRGILNMLAGKQNRLTFDDAPVSGSANPVKSGGIYNALQAIAYEIATEEEAIGGTDNSTLMTPLRVDQAFNEKFKVIDGVLNVFENGEWVEYAPK